MQREGSVLTLQFDPLNIQSQVDLENPDRLLLGYTRTLLGFLLFTPDPQHITLLGLGGGALPTYCYRHFPLAKIDVAEINPQVVALRNTFRIPADDHRFAIHTCDGAAFIAKRLIAQDVIIVDGFDVGGQSFSLCTDAFYNDCHRALRNGGVLAINLSDNPKPHARLIKRIRRCFNEAVLVVTADECTNKIVFAVKQDPASEKDFSYSHLLTHAAELDRLYPVSFRQIVERMAGNKHNPLNA